MDCNCTVGGPQVDVIFMNDRVDKTEADGQEGPPS